jgi:uncharacterized surface protein with fasciclin (FAS1) repeats
MRHATPPTRVALAALVLTALAACSDDAGDTPEGPPEVEPIGRDDIVAAAREAGLTTLVALADTAGLVGTLQGEGPYTVFAPTNEAFEALPQATRDSLLLPANRPRLQRLLRYHVVPGRIETNMLPMSVQTVEGSELAFEQSGADYVVRDGGGGAVRVVTTDLNVTNGVVHVLDGVLTPPAPADGEQADGGQ